MANVKFTSYVEEVMKQTRVTTRDDVTTALEAVEAELEHVRMDNEKDIRDLVRRLERLEKGGVAPKVNG